MSKRKLWSVAVVAALALPGCVSIEETRTGPDGAVLAELATLRAKDEIRTLIVDYGRTLDARDFDGFAALWAEDAEYVGGPGGTPVAGSQEIADFLEGVFAANPSGLEGPTAHVFFNETIEVEGDRATGASLGGFVAQGEGGVEMVILAAYEDEYVMEAGRWKFARRVVRGLIPGAR